MIGPGKEFNLQENVLLKILLMLMLIARESGANTPITFYKCKKNRVMNIQP